MAAKEKRKRKDLNLMDKFLFDLFGQELYQYTFRMKCEEVQELELEDGATRIFLNSHGKHPELVSTELVELLKYMERSTDNIVNECESERIHQMHERINRLKSDKEMEIKYMQKWEEKELDRQEAYAEGRSEGEQIGKEQINKLIKYLLEQGRNEDLEKAVSDSEYQEKLLKELGLS